MAKKKKTLSWQAQILLISFIIVAVLFLPTTLIFFIGMMPSICARVMDHSKEKVKVFTIGFMNFAGCFPFWFQLIKQGHDMDTAMRIIGQPTTIVVMYLAACLGYLVEWGVKNIVAYFMLQRGQARLKDILKIQDEMIKKWGPEVTGDVPMDMYGFAIEEKEK